MMETMTQQASEALRLTCPRCGGGLNLKREHLGITGQCVHCRTPLSAVERAGGIEVVTSDAREGEAEVPIPAPAIQESIESAARSPICETVPLFPSPAPMDFRREMPVMDASLALGADFPDTVKTEYAAPLLNSGNESLFADRVELSAPSPETPLFGAREEEPDPFSWMFKNEDDSSAINPAWGTKVPRETHASISPFETGSAVGGGFAETLFREKVVKESASDDFTFAIPFSVAKAKEEAAPAPRRDCAEKVILDGDGRRMAPMTKEEEEDFAKSFFAMERARGRQPKWKKRLIRILTLVVVLGLAGIVAFFVTPQEKLAEWKTNAITWLEPGMAVFDYLPEGMRPDWLPRTDFGIDAGLDENGNPKPKMNAFDGLKKLETDIGNMRGAADEELKSLNDF